MERIESSVLSTISALASRIHTLLKCIPAMPCVPNGRSDLTSKPGTTSSMKETVIVGFWIWSVRYLTRGLGSSRIHTMVTKISSGTCLELKSKYLQSRGRHGANPRGDLSAESYLAEILRLPPVCTGNACAPWGALAVPVVIASLPCKTGRLRPRTKRRIFAQRGSNCRVLFGAEIGR